MIDRTPLCRLTEDAIPASSGPEEGLGSRNNRPWIECLHGRDAVSPAEISLESGSLSWVGQARLL